MIMTITSLPATVLSLDEQDSLAAHYKNKFEIGLKHGEKPVKYSPDERYRIGLLYNRCRDFGYFPTGIDRFGRLVYQKNIKSAVQRLLEQGLKPIAA